MYSNDFEDLIEHAYWVFDARRNGYPPYKNDTAYSERDDFKMALREALSKLMGHPGDDDPSVKQSSPSTN
jgi:hypothetical protein